MELSNVAVILAFAVGAALAGVIGALIALPLAAAYPAIERIWLREGPPPKRSASTSHRKSERGLVSARRGRSAALGRFISSTSGTSATNMMPSSWKMPTNDTIVAWRWTMPKSAA